MTHYTRPSELIFAESAKPDEVVPFPDYSRGWGVAFDKTGGFPPMEWFNDLFQRMSLSQRYFMQRGISEWSNTEDYPVGAYVQYNDETWKSIEASKGNKPNISKEWVKWGFKLSEITQLIKSATPDATLTTKGIVQLDSSVNSTSTTKAATPSAVKQAYDNADTRVPATRKINGKALTSDISITLADLSAVDTLYPVGIVILFAENKNPNTLFPGTTWKYVGEERTIRLGKMDGSDLKELGGFDTVSLSVANMPAHAHTFSATSSAFDYGTKTVSTFDYGTKTSNTTGNHTHNGRIATSGGGNATIAGGYGDLNRSSSVMDAAGNHAHTVGIGAHNHTVAVGAHTHTVSGTTSSMGSGTSFGVTNSYIKLMGWYRSA